MVLDIDLHKSLLVRILKDIFTNSEIAPYLVFKGGTAALLFYDLPRFSVDLDFDLLDATKASIVFVAMSRILTQYGTIKANDKRYNLFFLLSYENKALDAQNIKVEINKRAFGSQYHMMHHLGIAMQVMVKADMAAHKLVAMHERIGKTNRDIFDVWFFFANNWPVNKKIVEARTGKSYADFLRQCIKDLEEMSKRGILSGIGELLNAKQKAWVKAHLKDETIFLLKLALSHEQSF